MTGRGQGPRRRGRIGWALTEAGMAQAARQDRIDAHIRWEWARGAALHVLAGPDAADLDPETFALLAMLAEGSGL